MAEKIISKGTYSHPGVPNFVSAKQYIVVQKGKKRHLFLRFENPRNDKLTSISFSVDLLDSSGMVIGHTKIEKKSLNVRACSGFAINKSVIMPDGCADFKVTVHSASYGDYRCITHGDEVQVLYEKQKDEGEIDNVPFLKRLGGAVHKAAVKSLSAPGFFFTLVAIITLAFALIVGMKVYDFTRTEVCFTLDKIDYTFATEDRKNGPIIIIGYKSNASNVIIPDSIEGHDVLAVEAEAFANSNIRTIKFEGSIEVRPRAFINCMKLESIYINSTESIGENAFYNCVNLKNVSVSKSLESIDKNAFGNCQSLREISIPDTLKSINDHAFYNCSSLNSLTLPDSVESIGKSILSKCNSLNTLKVPFLGATEKDDDALSYFFASNTPSSLKNLIVTKTTVVSKDMFRDEKHIENVTFTGKVTSIGAHAFDGCRALVSVSIPASVSAIGEYAFADCTSLKSLVVPTNVTEIKEAVFSGCTSLETLTLPENLTKIGNYAFCDCSSLSALGIPSGVTSIGRNALKNCTGLRSLVTPFIGSRKDGETTSLKELLFGDQYGTHNPSESNLEELTVTYGASFPSYAFYGFTNLRKLTLPAELESISEGCFMNCVSLNEFNIPLNVSYIGADAFSGCASLRAAAIPSNVTHIATRTFYGCSSIESISLHNNIVSIDSEAFKDCMSLTSIQIPSNITSLAPSLFEGCSSIKEIALPARLTKISSSAFSGCSSLQSISFPSTLTEIGGYSFSGCASLESVEISENVITVGDSAFAGCSSMVSFTLPESVSYIGNLILENCTSLESLTAPFPTKFSPYSTLSYYFSYYGNYPTSLNSVNVTSVSGAYLPENAFAECTNVTSITLPSGLTSIGYYAFKNCVSLLSLEIPDSVTYMGTGMLYGTTSLKEITLPYAGSGSGQYDSGFSNFYYYDYYSSTPQNLKKVTITKATYIPYGSFQYFTSIEEVNLPDTLYSIGNYAFSGCTSLKSITIPENVTYIEYEAFSGCYRLYEVTNNSSYNFSNRFPEAIRVYSKGESKENTKISSQSFTFLLGTDGVWYLTGYDSSLKTQNLPSNITLSGTEISYSLPPYIFSQTPIESVSIPGCVKSIGREAFSLCNSLTSVTFSSGVESIGNYAFSYSAISSIDLPMSLTTIGESAFYCCSRLSSVTFASGSRLNSIGVSAFNSSPITSIDIPASVETIGSSAFYGCYQLASLSFGVGSIIKSIESYAFAQTPITKLSLPSTLEALGTSAFENCSSLSSLSFDANSQLKTISTSAFYGTAITSLTIPASVEYIGSSSFYYCQSLASLTFDSNSNLKSIESSAFAGTALKSVVFPASLETIGDSSFSSCTSLANISFPYDSSLKTIASYAFYSTAIKSLSLPASVTDIYYYAFGYCQSLSSVTIRSNANINDYAFSDCGTIYEVYNLAGLSLEIGSYNYGGIAREALIIHTDSMAESLTDVNTNNLLFKKSGSNWFLMGPSAETKITSLSLDSFTYGGQSVNSFVVHKYAFYNNSDITSVYIGDAVTKIGMYSFANCWNIKELTFSATSPLTAIPSNAFQYCSGITSVTLPSNVTTIDYYAFQGCSAMEYVVLPSKLESVSYYAFGDCTSLYDVMNPSKLNITKDYSYTYGNIADYALAIRSSTTPLETQAVTGNGISAKFAKHSGTWYLVSLKITGSPSVIAFPELVINNKTYDYKVFNYALYSTYISYYNSIILPKSIIFIDSSPFSKICNNTIYYTGDSKEFEALKTASNYYVYGNVYYYSACIHDTKENNYWNYDDKGGINTKETELVSSITKEPTCKEAGVETFSCPVCKLTETKELPMNDNHDLENGKCKICNKKVTAVTKDNFDKLEVITNDEKHEFVIDDEGVITSTNMEGSSSATLTITAKTKITVTFSYRVSSESNWDTFKILKGKTQIANVSGEKTDYATASVTLEAGESLTFTYSKDARGDGGDDCAYIKDLMII